MAVVAKRVLFFGQVQGVGFRRQTERAARGLSVTGFVRNLADGSVELIAEGEDGALATLLGRIEAVLGPNIERQEESVVPPVGGDGFEVRF